MTARRLLIAALIALLPTGAHAQLDDLLTPLAPQKEEKKTKKKRPAKKKRVKKRRTPPPAEQEFVVPLVPQNATVQVRVSGPQEGAVVTLDGRVIQPGQKVEVDAGQHTIVVRRPGWSEFTRRVTVTEGQALEVPALMDAIAGVLNVTADVPGSLVFVDGTRVGEAPVTGLLLEPGSRVVTVRREGFEDSVSNLSVRAGRDYTVKGNLRPLDGTRTLVASSGDRPEATRLVPGDPGADSSLGLTGDRQPEVRSEPWFKRWYVWAGVGAVAAAAVTSAVVVSSNAGAGSLTPASVCGGECDDVINSPGARF